MLGKGRRARLQLRDLALQLPAHLLDAGRRGGLARGDGLHGRAHTRQEVVGAKLQVRGLPQRPRAGIARRAQTGTLRRSSATLCP
jgi:hypothetical protein